VDAIVDLVHIASKNDNFLIHLIHCNQLVPIVNVLLRYATPPPFSPHFTDISYPSGERDHDFLLHGLRVVSSAITAVKPIAASDAHMWSLLVSNVGYVVNSMLFEKLRSVAIAKKDGFVSTNVKDYHLFIETVRLLSCITLFVREATETVSTVWPDRHAEIGQLANELISELIATDFVDIVSHLASFLLQDGPPHRSKKQISRDAHFLSCGVVEVLNTCAKLNIKALQVRNRVL